MALHAVVIGTGMYACGRGTDGFGTIMPALLEWARTHPLGEVSVVGNSPSGVAEARAKIEQLQQRMGMRAAIRYAPVGSSPDPLAYQRTLRSVPLPACAIVVVPDHLHRAVAGAALECGLHTLVVKPLAPTLREAEELLALQREHRCYCMVEFHKRWDRANLLVKDAVARGELGELVSVLVQYSQRKSVPAERFRAWVEQTDCFQYLGVHYVDLIHFITGAWPRRAMATGRKGWLAAQGLDTYDAIQAVVEWELPSGRRFAAHLLTGWVDPERTSAMSDQRLSIIGTRGRIESDQKRRGLLLVTDARGVEEPNQDFCVAYGPEGEARYRGYGIDSVGQFLTDVVELQAGRVGLDELERARPSFQQALVSTGIAEAVRTSLAQDSTWVEVAPEACRA